MTFLQPALLWGLPAVILPVLIHFLNRLRYRSVKWAAMMFLISANRSSTRSAVLRHYLILLCRMLIILFLVFALSRPLVGGWFGALAGGSLDTVVMLLDRSATMETTDPQRQVSKRAHALALLQQASRDAGPSCRFVLIENAVRTPIEIPNPSVLPELEMTGPTDTAADIPAMLRAALEYMTRNKTGRAEIWIASDMQESNWRPESGEWQSLSEQIAGLPQGVAARVLDLSSDPGRNISVSFHNLSRLRKKNERAQLSLALDFTSLLPKPDSFPVIITLDGVRSQSDVSMKGQVFRFNGRLDLASERKSGGWGKVEIPADENPRDNACYFVYGEDPPLRAAMAAENTLSVPYLQLAAAPDPSRLNRFCDVVEPSAAERIRWRDLALLIWQSAAPTAETAGFAQSFVENGGVALCLPPGRADTAGLFGQKWGRVETAEAEKPFRIASWDEADGPLSRADSGANLPVASLAVTRRQIPAAAPGGGNGQEWHDLALFADGKPFLLSRKIGAGCVFACTTLPQDDWSTLGEGRVLVPMIQRMLRLGGERLSGANLAVCGEWKPPSEQEIWTPLPPAGSRDWRWNAGIYECGMRRVALNRPAVEDLPGIVDKEKVAELFGKVRVQVVGGAFRRSTDKLQSEIWHLLVCMALVCMIAESWLVSTDAISRKAAASGLTGATGGVGSQ